MYYIYKTISKKKTLNELIETPKKTSKKTTNISLNISYKQ